MDIIEIEPGREDLDWDGLVNAVPEGTIYQTTYWGDYVRKNEGVEPIFLAAKDESGRIAGSLLAYEAPYFRKLLRFGQIGEMLYRIANKKKIAMTWLYGPVIYNKERFDEVFTTLIEGIEKIARKRRILFLKAVSHPIHGDEIYLNHSPRILSANGFKDIGKATIFLSLQKDEKELWNGLRNSARKAIKKSLDDSIEVRFLERDELASYYKLLRESRRRVRIEMPPTYPDEAMWDTLAAEEKFLNVFSVYKDGRMLAAIGIISFNGIIFETGPAQSDHSVRNKIYANDILKWEVIKWGRRNGKRLYDLSGIPAKIKNESEQAQVQFKKKWGGQIIGYKSYSKMVF